MKKINLIAALAAAVLILAAIGCPQDAANETTTTTTTTTTVASVKSISVGTIKELASELRNQSGTDRLDITFTNGTPDFTELRQLLDVNDTIMFGLDFSQCTDITSLTSDNDLFHESQNIVAVTIPSTVDAIENSVFYGCSNLQNINVAEDNPKYTSIDGVLFSASGIELIACPAGRDGTYNVPNGTAVIDYGAFFCCKFTEINISKHVTAVQPDVFVFCSNLQNINVAEDNPKYMSIDGVLFSASGTELIACPVGRDGTYNVPNGTAVIYCAAFAFCKFTEINISKHVTAVQPDVFVFCSNLQNINVDSDNKSYKSSDGVLFNADMTKLIAYPADRQQAEYIVPTGVTSIFRSAFLKCNELTSITIPDSVTSIEMSALQNCDALTEVTIGTGISEIGAGFLHRCPSLTSLTIRATTPPSLSHVGFEESDALQNIYVPNESLEDYRSAQYWSDYSSIIKPIE